MFRVLCLTSLICASLRPATVLGADKGDWEPVVQAGHSRAIRSVALSEDGRFVLTGAHDNDAILWDAVTGRQLRTLSGHVREIVSVALSGDGRYALTGSADRTAILWDAQSGQKLRTFGLPEPVGRYRASLSAVAMTPDAGRILIASTGPAILLDARTGERLREYDGHESLVRCMALSADGHRFITGAIDRKAIVWDIETGQKIREFFGGEDDSRGRVHSVAISRNGRRVLVGSGESVSLWDVESGDKLQSFAKDSFYRSSVGLSGDGRLVLRRSGTPNAALHDADSGRKLHDLKTDDMSRVDGFLSHFVAGVFSSDGRHLVTASHSAVAIKWDTQTGRRLVRYGSDVDFNHRLEITRDSRLAVTSTDKRTQILWDTRTARNLQTFDGHRGQVSHWKLTPDARHLITSGWDDDRAILWEADTGRYLRSFNGHRDSILSTALSFDSRTFLTGSADKSAILWDMNSGQKLQTFGGPDKNVWHVDLSVDGQLAATTFSREAVLWDTQTGRRLQTFEDPRNSIDAVRLSPSGKLMATASDKTLVLWNTQTGEEQRRLEFDQRVVTEIAFSPDSKQLLTRSQLQGWPRTREVSLWDTESGKKLRTMASHWWYIVRAKWHDQGQRRVVVPGMPTVVPGLPVSVDIHDADTGAKLARLYRFNSGKDWLAVSPDGEFDGSPGCERFLSYRAQKTLDLLPVDQFRAMFRRPGLLAEIWNHSK